MTFNQYVEMVRQLAPLHPEWREGQRYFNTLHDVRPDLADKVINAFPIVDPFYRDELIASFLGFVGEQW
jgi:hypothetical protein